MADLTAEEEDIVVRPMPVGSPGRKSSGWYGILALIVTEASLFVYLLFSYYYTWLWTDGHFLPSRRPDISLSAPDTVILPPGMFKAGRVLEVFAESGWKIKLVDLIERGADFERCTYGGA